MTDRASAGYQALITKFSGLRVAEEDRPFELAITEIVTGSDGAFPAHCRRILEDGEKDVAAVSEDVAYCAFFALATYYRRVKSYTELERLMGRYGAPFESRGLFPHLQSLLHKGKGSDRDLRKALDHGQEAVRRLPEHEGVLHSFAETVAICLEAGLPAAPDDEVAARQAVDRVIGQTPKYAKYHCTRGRLQALQGEYGAALESVSRAIDLEEPNRVDYPIRLSDYQAVLSRIRFEQMSQILRDRLDAAEAQLASTRGELEDALRALKAESAEVQQATRTELKEDLEELKRQNLTVLGFFAAIISVTIGSIQLLGRQSFDEAAMLIIILAGAMLSVYAAFSALFSDRATAPLRALGVVLFGVVLMAAGLVIPRLMEL